jgi:hypothetical protein
MSNTKNFFSDSGSEIIIADGIRQEVHQFDFDAVEDRGNPLAAIVHEEEPNPFQIGADGIAEILSWIWSSGPNRMDAALRKLVMLTALLNGSLLNGEHNVQLAARLNCTKACLSKLAQDAQRVFGTRFRRGRKESGIINMRLARLKQLRDKAKGKVKV